MLKELQDFGLSEKEAKVYMASLEIGKATADQLSKHAKVNRSTTYVQIESLSEKGLMTSYEEGKKTFFAAESPEYLKRLFEKERQNLESKEKELIQVLPNLVRMFEGAGERPVVRFFEGKEGILTLREETLNAKEKVWRVLYSHDSLADLFSADERREYSSRRIEKKIFSKIIYTRKEGALSADPMSASERKFVSSEKLNLESDLVIFDDKIALMALKGRYFGVLIQNENLAKSFKSLFDFLWGGVVI